MSETLIETYALKNQTYQVLLDQWPSGTPHVYGRVEAPGGIQTASGHLNPVSLLTSTQLKQPYSAWTCAFWDFDSFPLSFKVQLFNQKACLGFLLTEAESKRVKPKHFTAPYVVSQVAPFHDPSRVLYLHHAPGCLADYLDVNALKAMFTEITTNEEGLHFHSAFYSIKPDVLDSVFTYPIEQLFAYMIPDTTKDELYWYDYNLVRNLVYGTPLPAMFRNEVRRTKR